MGVFYKMRLYKIKRLLQREVDDCITFKQLAIVLKNYQDNIKKKIRGNKYELKKSKKL